MNLVQRDREALRAAIGALAEVRPLDALRRDTVEILPTLVATNLIGWNEVDVERGHIEFVMAPKRDFPGSQDVFVAHMADHPVLAHYRATADGRPRAISDFLGVREFHATGLYQHVYKRLGAEDQISFVLPESSLVIGIALNRAKRGFSGRDRALLNLVRPHLTQAYRNAKAFSRLADALDGMEKLVERDGDGVVLLDAKGRVELVGATGEEILRRWFPRSRHGALPGAITEWLVASRRDAGPIWPLVLERRGGRLVVRRLPFDGGEAVVMSEPSQPCTPTMVASLGLTYREAEVMALMARGRTTTDIAAELGIRNHTVYNHVHNSLHKLGTTNRGEAMNLIAQAEHGASV